MKKIVSIVALLLFTLLSFAQDKPNIVLLFVDDMGWADLGYRQEVFQTPNINQLKKDGLDFSRAYIATPTCSPSRASLLTGKEPVRFQMSRHISGGPDEEFSLWPKDPVQRPSRNYLPLEEVTYAEALKEHTYYNKFVGKWHLGHEPYYPVHQGFDEAFHTNDHGHPKSYYHPYFKTGNDYPEAKEGDYLTDVLTDEATRFILDYDKEQPFMLTMWYFNVHGPHMGRKDWIEKYEKEGLTGKAANYAAMVSAMDESVGRVRAALEEKGISENTVIIFLSDQGGAFKNGPLSGGKKGGNTLGEGGARVPLIVHYPGVTKPASSSDVPVQSIDIFPTLMEIASGETYKNKAIQGKSLMPLLEGETLKSRYLFGFRSYEDQYCSIITGDWKMIKYHSGKFQLYNLKENIGETNNLVGKGLKQEKKLKKKLAKWEKEAVPAY